MELALLKTLLNREFYNQHKGLQCPDKIFSKDVRKIKQALDTAMETYDTDLSVSDLQAVFNRINASMTTAMNLLDDIKYKMDEDIDKLKELCNEVSSNH